MSIVRTLYMAQQRKSAGYINMARHTSNSAQSDAMMRLFESNGSQLKIRTGTSGVVLSLPWPNDYGIHGLQITTCSTTRVQSLKMLRSHGTALSNGISLYSEEHR